MKNILKNALLVCLILCMTVCLGLFAAACDNDNTPPNQQEEEENTNNTAEVPEVTLSSTSTPVTVDGATKVYFLAGVGTYKCTVNLSEGSSFELSLGSEKHTVSYDNNSFVFSVTLANTFTKAGATETSTGFEVTITPDADNEDNAVSINLKSLSSDLKKGNNTELYAESKVIDTFAITPFDMHGEHKFELDVADGDSYTVNVAGKDYTVDKDDNTVTVNLTSANRDSNQLGADLYFVTLTPAANNTGKTVSLYVIQPEQVVGVSEKVTASPIVTPEVVEKNENVLIFHFNKPEGVTQIKFDGAVSGATFAMYECGETEVLRLKNMRAGDFSQTFRFDVDEAEFTYKVVFTFTDESGYTFYGQFWDNHILVDRGDEYASTEIYESDADDDGNYIYTFTASEAGYYQFRFYGDQVGADFAVKVNGTDVETFAPKNWQEAKTVLELAAGDVVTVTVTSPEGVDSEPYELGASISVVQIIPPPAAVLDQEMTVSGDYDGTEFTFTATEAGTYVLTILSEEIEESYIRLDDYNWTFVAGSQCDYRTWEYSWTVSGEFEVAADETVTFLFFGSGSRPDEVTFKITKK